MTDEAFKRGMAVMTATWPDRKPTVATFDVYMQVLQHLHDSVFEAAINACLASCRFFPVPAEIITAAQQVLNASGLLPAEGEQAWADVLRACRTWHPDLGWVGIIPGYEALGRLGNAPCPLSPRLQQAIDAVGGMGRIWNANDRDLGFIRQEFLRFYGQKREAELRYSGDWQRLSLPKPERLKEIA